MIGAKLLAGIIETDNQKAVFKGYFLPAEVGKEAYEIKVMQDMQQFSYGFQVMKSEKGKHIDSKGEEVRVVLQDVKVWEVSPVLLEHNKIALYKLLSQA